MLWCKLLVCKGLIGWLSALVSPLAGAATDTLTVSVAPATTVPTAVVATSEAEEHTSYDEVWLGRTGENEVALTLDLGPWADGKVADEIVDVLQREGVTATLFLSGRFVERYPGLVARADACGYELANHTYSHPDLTKVSRAKMIEELEKTQSLIEEAVGHEVKPRYFRPPYGASSKKVLQIAESMSFRSIMWTVEALDWKEGASVDGVVARVTKKTRDGAIILMHITEITQSALPVVLERLRSQGYSFVSLEEIVQEPRRQGR